ncbi:MAG: hypothetical protein Q9198_000976 [Flavoplaca austrocitrina]
MAQQAVDVAQENYDQSVAKQAEMAAAIKEVEKKLEKLKEAGASLIKVYFSVLVDISSMYTSIDRSHIREGVDLCTQLSKSAASKETSRAIQDKLSTYTKSAAKEVAKIVSTKQQEILKDLKARS